MKIKAEDQRPRPPESSLHSCLRQGEEQPFFPLSFYRQPSPSFRESWESRKADLSRCDQSMAQFQSLHNWGVNDERRERRIEIESANTSGLTPPCDLSAGAPERTRTGDFCEPLSELVRYAPCPWSPREVLLLWPSFVLSRVKTSPTCEVSSSACPRLI